MIFKWFFNKYSKNRNKKWGYQKLHNEKFKLKNLQEALGGAKDIKILNKQDEFSKIFNLYNSTTARLDRNVEFLNWRLFNNPFITYKVYGFIKDNKVSSY